MQVQVPPGVVPGQAVMFQLPDGSMQQAIVPQGLSPGDMFIAAAAPAQPVQMQRDPEDAAAARTVVAKMVGNWKLRGYGYPSCFCPLIWQVPFTHTGQFTVQPLDTNGKHQVRGHFDHWVLPFLGLPCSALHVCPIASMAIAGEYDASGMTSVGKSRNVNKSESLDPLGGWTTVTRTLTSIDAANLKATYAISGSGPLGAFSGTRTVDAGAEPMTYTDEIKSRFFIGPTHLKVVGTKM